MRASTQTPYAIAIYIAICALLSLIAAALMSDYTGKDIEGPRQAAAIAAE